MRTTDPRRAGHLAQRAILYTVCQQPFRPRT
jgi:hypothetical protein